MKAKLQPVDCRSKCKACSTFCKGYRMLTYSLHNLLQGLQMPVQG